MVDRVETVVVGKREVRFLIDQQADHVVLAFADGVVKGGVAFGILEVKWEGVSFSERSSGEGPELRPVNL